MAESDNSVEHETVDPSAPPPEKFKRVRPTLYIGIGGTGKEVLLRLRRRILQHLWNGKRVESLDGFPVASFLYVDTYRGEAEDEERSSKKGSETDPLLPLIKLPEDDQLQPKWEPGKYVQGQELERYPHIKEWLPPRNELGSINVEKGAGQVRALSRLLFFDQVRVINEAVSNKARRLLQNVGNERLKELGLDIEEEVKIVVICSIAGGTGSGAFIDMGFLCRSLQNPKPGDVHLYAVTGSAFAGIHDRVLANSYAALAELEYCMRGEGQEAYVSGWGNLVNRAATPYTEAYLVDNANLASQSTGDRNHMFGMVADSLLEELHDPVLRGKRSEALVNQEQFKIVPFVPPGMPEDLGRHSQRFSRAYSSFGQVTLYTQGRIEFERETAEAARDMIRAFFRMTEHDQENLPTGPEVKEFLASQLDLPEGLYFKEFPEWLPNAKGRSLPDFPLVDRLLQRDGDGTQVDVVQAGHVREDFAGLRESGRDLSDWRSQAELLRKQREREIAGSADSSSSSATYPRHITTQRGRIMAKLKVTLRRALYARLDNRDKGGLTYTMHLIKELRDELLGEGTGICTRLDRSARELEELSRELKEGYYAQALGNLEKAAKKGLLRGPDRESCLRFLGQAEEATRYYLMFRLRALACREAVKLLSEDVIQELGQPSALDEDSATGASGILGEFEEGRSAVRKALEGLAQEIRVLDDTANARTPLRNFIPGGGMATGAEVDRGSLVDWGTEALEQYGGSHELFEQLRNVESRTQIISTLRGKAREKMQDREQRLPTVQEALRAMSLSERKRLFQETFRNAMPWVNADINKDPDFVPEMMTIFVAVENVSDFLREFGDEIRPVLDSKFTQPLYQVASGERGRLVVYSEYSGMPLNVLIALHDDWRRAYESLSQGEARLPLHNHRRSERFQRPTALDLAEFRLVHNNLKLFLKGVALGILRRRPGPDGYYELNVSSSHVADWQSIGREQQIYLTGFPPGKEGLLRQIVESQEGEMGPRQKLLVATLFSFLAERSYAPIKVMNTLGEEERWGGIAHHAAKALSDEYVQLFEASRGRRELPAKTEDLMAAAYGTIESWSQEIPDSLKDTTAQEANLNPSPEDRAYKAQPKRWIDLARHTDTQIDEWLGLSPAEAAAPANALEVPPLPNTRNDHTSYKLALDGQQYGPVSGEGVREMYVAGRISGETLIWRNGLSRWVKCHELEDLKDLFALDEDAPPLPPE